MTIVKGITAEHRKVLKHLYLKRNKKTFYNLETFFDYQHPHQNNAHSQTIIQQLSNFKYIDIQQGTGHPYIIHSRGGKSKHSYTSSTFNHPYQPVHARITKAGSTYYYNQLIQQIRFLSQILVGIAATITISIFIYKLIQFLF